MKRGIASGDVETAVYDTRCFIQHAVSPHPGRKTVFGTKRAQGNESGCEFQRRRGIELFVLTLRRDHSAVESLDEHSLVTVEWSRRFRWRSLWRRARNRILAERMGA